MFASLARANEGAQFSDLLAQRAHFFEQLVVATIVFVADEEGRDVGGDTNIRDCRSTSPQTLDCVWFLFVPEPLREDALAEGIYGVTWIMHFGFDGNDRLQNIGIELLIERL